MVQKKISIVGEMEIVVKSAKRTTTLQVYDVISTCRIYKYQPFNEMYRKTVRYQTQGSLFK